MLETKLYDRKSEFENSWESLAMAAKYQPMALAKLCEVSLRTVQRHFKREYGMTVSEWLRRKRAERARELILAGERIKAVAIELGFRQLSHFSRSFKEEFGISPRHFQQANQSREVMGMRHCMEFPRKDAVEVRILEFQRN